MNTRIIGMLLLTCCFISGCDVYSEGDNNAKKAFEKMTMQEKTLYKAVEHQWSQGDLITIRQAVFSRDAKPSENDIPFIDIPGVIKTNNDITLKTPENYSQETKDKNNKAKWDKLDENWYLKIVNKYNSINSIKTTDLVQQPKTEYVVKSEPKIVIEKEATPEEIIAKNKKNGYVPEKDYDDIYFNIKRCPTAVEFYQKVVKERLLNSEDVDFLNQLSTECKAKTIGDRLKWTK